MHRLFFRTTSIKIASPHRSAIRSSIRLLSDAGDSQFLSFFDSNEFNQRYHRLAESLPSSSPSKLLLIPAADVSFVADTIIPQIHYRQNAEFTYLTGLNTIEAAGCVFMLSVKDGRVERRHMFTPALAPRAVIWEGPGVRQSSYEAHLQSLQIELGTLNELRQMLQQSKCDLFATRWWHNRPDRTANIIQQKTTHALSPYLDQLRVIKSEKEMQAMRRSCRLAVDAMNSTIQFGSDQLKLMSGSAHVYEQKLAAHFEYMCCSNGSPRLSYPSVVAGSDRAVTIHYGSNHRPIRSTDWVLMDAGCEDPDGYASDVTRCWPLNQQSNAASLTYALYQALCSVQQDLISRIQVGYTTLNTLLQDQTRLLAYVLQQFNVIPRSLDSRSTQEAVYRFCPHHVSHYLGLDVHDSASYSRDQPLRPGMCFTIEPGLYFRPDQPDVADEFKGIGLRVEDDILINQDAQVENLTKNCRYFS